MHRKTMGDKPAFDHEVLAPAIAAPRSKSTRTGRFHLNRGTHHVQRAVIAKYAAMRAHNSVLSPAGMALQLESRIGQQQVALNSWEDEGGRVRRQARAKVSDPIDR